MTPDGRRSADRIFADALERPAAERAAFVLEACAGDEELAAEVNSLLEAHAKAGSFLDAPPPTTAQPQQIDRYRLVRRLGRGGMADVFLAERADATFTKQVALKLIRRGVGGTPLVERFLAERQALAQLEHPHIARLIDGGSTEEGRPFLVMEHVDGDRIDEYCDRERARVDDRLRLFLDVCSAVQYAHRNLIVHRDLKPANIFVTGEGHVKLLDFGIAKFLDGDPSTALTATQQRAYTPAYASPEQIRGEPITTATDVYALGVVCFELLVGRRPYRLSESSTPVEVHRAVCEEPPTRPRDAFESTEESVPTAAQLALLRSTVETDLRRSLGGDLEMILLKALRKEPARRYESVEALAEDLRRYLGGQPVLAQPDSWGYRARKFVNRNRALVAGLASGGLALIAGLAVSTTLFFQAERAREGERQQRIQSENTSLFLENLLAKIDPNVARGRDTELLKEVLDDAALRVETELQQSPRVAARVRRVIGAAYTSIGEYDVARTHLEEATEAARRWQEPVALGVALTALVRLESDLGNYGEGTARAREAIAAFEAGNSGRSLESARAHLALARARQNEGDVPESNSALETLLTWVGAVPGGAELETEALTTLGRGYAIELQSEQAIATLERARARAVEVHGTQHRLTARASLYLGWAHYRAEDPAAAEPHFRDALRLSQAVMPSDHPDIASALNQLAGALQDLGRLEEAEELLVRAVERFRAAYGDEHPDVGTAYNNLARVYADQQRYDLALENMQRAVDTYGAVLGPDHVYVGIVQQNMLAIYSDQGRLREFEDKVDQTAEILIKAFGRDNVRSQYILALQAMADAHDGRFEEAEAALLQFERASVEAGRQLTIQRVRKLLVKFYEEWNRPDSAAEWSARLDS